MQTEVQNGVIHPAILPLDEYNKELRNNVHPPEWVNPEPAECYNLVVIGAGTAGLITAIGGVGLGAKVALIERHLTGGDCLNVGCVPSKALIRCARAVHEARRANEFGVRLQGEVEVDFAAIMQRMRRIRASISPHDSVWRLRDLGIDVFLGEGSFINSNTIEVADHKLRFKKAVIASGARAFTPLIPGLAEAGYLTNETVFSLTRLPRRLAVIGGGPIGCELSQAFRRFGSEVTILQSGSQFLRREDQDAVEILTAAFARDGIEVRLSTKTEKIVKRGEEKELHIDVAGKKQTLTVDEILVSAGRAPNVDMLNLDAVGIEYDMRRGVIVNDFLQTSNPKIYAAGDISLAHKFTHTADAAARVVLANALFLGRRRYTVWNIPWCTYTDPEIAHVGMYEHEAERKGIEFETLMTPFASVDRAITEGETEGFVKIHVKKGSDKVLGATIVGREAGSMISEITVAMVGGVGLKTIANAIHPYPTQAEAIRKTADAFNRKRLTPFVQKLFQTWLAWNR